MANQAGGGTQPQAGGGTPPQAGGGTQPQASAGTQRKGQGRKPKAGAGTPPKVSAGPAPETSTGTPPKANTGTPPETNTGTPPETSTGMKAAYIGAAAAIIAAIIGGIFAIWPFIGGPSTPPGPKVTITSPTGDPVPIAYELTGRASNIPENHKLWAIVQFENDYFPQTGPIGFSSNGEWHTTVFVGNKTDSGKTFVIHVGMTGPDGTAQFTDYLRKGRETGSNPSVSTAALPPDLELLVNVTVVRQ
jgi:hypothetical protein